MPSKLKGDVTQLPPPHVLSPMHIVMHRSASQDSSSLVGSGVGFVMTPLFGSGVGFVLTSLLGSAVGFVLTSLVGSGVGFVGMSTAHISTPFTSSLSVPSSTHVISASCGEPCI